MISDLNTVFYSLAFLVPGFILHSTIAFLIPRKQDQAQLSIIRILTLSIFNYAIWSWLVYLIFHLKFFTESLVHTALGWGSVILIGPIFVALIWAVIIQKDIILKLFNKIGLKSIHVIPTAWDWKFSTVDESLWLLVTLKDGSRVAGLYAGGSIASSESGERDLFIQEVYRVVEDNNWELVPRSDGILILGNQISYIEFFHNEGEQPDE